MLVLAMQKATSTRSFVSEEERVRYVDGTMCLTFWFDQENQIIAFELIFGLAMEEWAFLYHRKGTIRYCRVDDGENRIGRPQKQAMSGLYKLPVSRVKEFSLFNGQVREQEKTLVLNIMKANCVQ